MTTSTPGPLPTTGQVTTVLRTARTYAIDLAERVIVTFLVATGGVLTTATAANIGHATFWEAAGAGGVAAAFSLVKGIVARVVGSSNSASLAKSV